MTGAKKCSSVDDTRSLLIIITVYRTVHIIFTSSHGSIHVSLEREVTELFMAMMKKLSDASQMEIAPIPSTDN